MKFAPHIGLSSPEDFMFPASAGSDPIDQIKFIIETWFAVNSSVSRPMIPPPRYKMAIVTWLAIFILIVIINLLFGSFLASLPMLLRSFVLTVGLVGLMTYVVMPRMTRLFSGWLYA